MTNHFDDLARALAGKMSRRQALKAALAAVAGSVVATAWPRSAAAAPNNCAKFCSAVFGEGTAEATACIQQAKRGRGPCYQVGPLSPACADVNCPRNTVCMSVSSYYYDYEFNHVCYPV